MRGEPVASALGAGLAIFLIAGSFVDIFARVFSRGATLASALPRALGLPRGAWGAALAHAGFGVSLLGLAATGWGVERIVTMSERSPVRVGPYQVTMTSSAARNGPNYKETYAVMRIDDGTATVATIEPARRFYAARNMSTTQAGIVTLNFGQIYISIADEKADGAIDARLYWKPLVSLIWLGALIMGFGGLVSLSDRKMRFGVARRAASTRPPAGTLPQPAE